MRRETHHLPERHRVLFEPASRGADVLLDFLPAERKNLRIKKCDLLRDLRGLRLRALIQRLAGGISRVLIIFHLGVDPVALQCLKARLIEIHHLLQGLRALRCPPLVRRNPVRVLGPPS